MGKSSPLLAERIWLRLVAKLLPFVQDFIVFLNKQPPLISLHGDFSRPKVLTAQNVQYPKILGSEIFESFLKYPKSEPCSFDW
jgi:hypothetical protein